MTDAAVFLVQSEAILCPERATPDQKGKTTSWAPPGKSHGVGSVAALWRGSANERSLSRPVPETKPLSLELGSCIVVQSTSYGQDPGKRDTGNLAD